MGCRSQTSRLRCAPEKRPNKIIPLLFYGHVFQHYMPPRVPACRREGTPTFLAYDRYECFHIQTSVPFSCGRLDMAAVVRESPESHGLDSSLGD